MSIFPSDFDYSDSQLAELHDRFERQEYLRNWAETMADIHESEMEPDPDAQRDEQMLRDEGWR